MQGWSNQTTQRSGISHHIFFFPSRYLHLFVMVSWRFLNKITGFSKMLSQLSCPWISSKTLHLQGSLPCGLSEIAVFQSIGAEAKTSFSVEWLYLSENPTSSLWKNRSCYGSRAACLLSFPKTYPFYGLQRKLFSCNPGAAQIQNFPLVGKSSSITGNGPGNRLSYGIKATHSISSVPVASSNWSPSSHTMARISRVARNEAQDALFDYLHSTRSMSFTDAEHISKNSPTFLQNLLAKVVNEQEMGRSITRFLRYHPINEFEPFLESLGLKPSELYPLLPRNLLFLSDDAVLLENFHVLCNYGVPRSKIGKMYMEGAEIFTYGCGVLSSKLQAYETLGLSVPTVIKLVTCCPSLLIGGVNGDFLQVLQKLKGLGIEHEWIRGCLSENNTYHWDRMLKMLDFLGEMGCNMEDLERLIREHPRFLFNDSGKKIYVLVAMLLKLGLKMNKIVVLFMQYPRILTNRFVKNLWQSVNFLSEIGMETKDIASVVCTHPQVLGSCSPKKPEAVLSNLNLGRERLIEIINEDPDQLTNLASSTKINLIKVASKNFSHPLKKTTFLLKLGFVENSDEMTRAQKQFRGRGDQLQERFDCLVNAGFDCHDVSNMVKGAPAILNQCTDVSQKKIDYLINTLGYPVESILAFPTFLCYNLERMKLRFSMYNWLREKGVVKPMLALSTVLAGSNARFVKYFVNLHPEGPDIWEQFKKSSPSS